MQNRLEKNDGFTLIEMLIAMVLFIVVIMITANIFELMLPKTKTITKSEESNIEGIIGLEMFRRDLEQAGFGLFTDIDSPPPEYSEVLAASPQSAYNDAPNDIPRAIVAKNNLTSDVLPDTDLLVIKATNAALNPASQCWTSIKRPGSSKIWGANDLLESRKGLNDHVVVVSQSFRNGELQRKLIYDTGSPASFAVPYKADGSYAAPFAPSSSDKQYYYYGIDSFTPRAPFNRTDYYVKRVAGDVPDSCSPAAGVLYKSVMNQADGRMQAIAVLDCVADMQVVLGWNTSGDPTGNVVDTWTNADGKAPSGGATAADEWLIDSKEIRNRLKLVKVYILAQDGGFDRNYNNTDTAMRVGEDGETGDPKFIDLTTLDRRHYRWKLHRLVVRPKNLN